MSMGILSAANYETDTFKTKNGQTLSIQFIKHGSLSISFEGHIIQIDPAGMFADYSKMPKADLILITHEHPDHFDAKAIAALEKSGTKIITNASTRKLLGKGIVMKNGDKLKPVSYLQLEAVPAYNTTVGREKFHPKGRDNGFILTLGGLRIYIAGDTEDIPEMNQLKNIDIAFLPVNQPYTMTVDQVINAAKVVKPRFFYPYHYGETKISEVQERLKIEAPGIEVRIRQMQ
jgi:Predicted Zn-dependent hydrolases of the beta-lactamase fold